MNSILTINNTDAIKTTDLLTTTPSVNTGVKGFDVTSTGVSSFVSDSFSKTMRETFAQLISNEASETTELGGDSLPISNVFHELSAEDGRSLADLNIDVSALLPPDLSPVDNKPPALNTADQLMVDKSQLLSLSAVETSVIRGNNDNSELNLSSPAVSLASTLIRSTVPSSDEFIKPVVSSSIEPLKESLAQQLTQLQGNEIRQPLEGRSDQLVAQPAIHPITQSPIQLAAQSITPPLIRLVAQSPQQSAVQLVAQIESEILTTAVIDNNNNTGNITVPVENMSQRQQTLLENVIASTLAKDSDKIDIHHVSTVNRVPKISIETVGNLVHDESLVLNDVLPKSKSGLENSLAQFQLKSALAASSSQESRVANHGNDTLNKVELSLSSPATTATISLDEDSAVLAPLNVLSSSLRTLLQARSSSNAKVSQENGLNVSSNVSGATPNNSTAKININTGLEMNLLQSTLQQSSDGLSLTTELPGLVTDKIQTSPNAFSQQQSLSATQSSQVASLLQAATTPVSPHSDSVTGIINPVLNNLSNINLQAVTQAEITEAFGRTAWSQGMGKQVLSMVNQNIGSAEIRLNPAHLGPIEILIDMSEDQVNVSLSSRHAIVREAMEQALPRLREMLDENGFNLADADISKHSFAEQREQNAENRKNASNMDDSNHTHLISSETSESSQQYVSSSSGTVDYFV